MPEQVSSSSNVSCAISIQLATLKTPSQTNVRNWMDGIWVLLQVGAKYERGERREREDPTWITSWPPHFDHVESFSLSNWDRQFCGARKYVPSLGAFGLGQGIY